MSWALKKEKFSYILRYYLPCLPQYEKEVTERRAEELIAFCKRARVDTVMLYVDLNPYWYYMPDSEEHADYVAEQMEILAPRLRAAGLSYQLNYQNLFGSVDGNYDHKTLCDWDCYTDEFGEVSLGVGCMLSERFQRVALRKLARFAKTKPDAIWIDDDIRIHNHRTELRAVLEGRKDKEELDFGCFCPLHMAAFSKKIGRKVTREEVRAAILAKGAPKELAIRYREFQREVCRDMNRKIEQTVHAHSPDTRVALMTSVPDVHAVEGRNWGEFLESLSGEHDPLIRSHFGPYMESDPRDFIGSYLLADQLRVNAEAQYTRGRIEYCPEIENTRFTRYAKSVGATTYQLDLSAFMNHHGVTLSIFDLEGCVLSEEPEWEIMLASHRPFCDRVTRELDKMKTCGVGLLTTPDRYPLTEKKNESGRISATVQKRPMETLIARLGIPVSYFTPQQIDAQEAILLERGGVCQLTDEELLSCLGKGLFLDGGAAEEIEKRGFGKYLGVKSGARVMQVAASERFTERTHADGSAVIIPSRIGPGAYRDLSLTGAKALSYLYTPAGDKHPGFTYFENELGGRICIYAAEGDFGDGFASIHRVAVLKEITSRLAPSLPTAYLPSYGLTAIRRDESRTAVFLANLSPDAAKGVRVRFERAPRSAYMILASGRKKELAVSGCEVCIPTSLPIYGTAVIVSNF
ncbi:MAG: hypothetical protein J6K14_04145 [Clostridia bacterium]|nr:hypothetical protein [Clostridia bacterium]